MDENVLYRVRQVAADLFDQPLSDVGPEASPRSLAAWDSMGHLNLVLALEQEFDVQFSSADLERIQSITTAAALVSARNSSR
jgi:acyl carrier protein